MAAALGVLAVSLHCVAPTTISPRPPGFACRQTRPVLVTGACRSAHLLAPTPTRLASTPWRMVGAGEGCTARGGARQWGPRRIILRLTSSGPAWPSRDRRRSGKWKRRSGKGKWEKWNEKKKKVSNLRKIFLKPCGEVEGRAVDGDNLGCIT